MTHVYSFKSYENALFKNYKIILLHKIDLFLLTALSNCLLKLFSIFNYKKQVMIIKNKDVSKNECSGEVLSETPQAGYV